MANRVFFNGVVELQDDKKDELLFKLNGHRLKPYFETRNNLQKLNLTLGDPSDHEKSLKSG